MASLKGLAYRLTSLGSTLKNLRVIDQRHLYALWEIDHLRRVLSHFEVDCVFDIGANHGQYATMLRNKVGYRGRIISFEPIPQAVQTLRALSANDPGWQVEEIAVSNADGQQKFNVMNDSQFSSLSAPRHDEVDYFVKLNAVSQTIDVRTERLATVYERLKREHGFQRPFLKMDTQGFDVEIVSHSREVLHHFIGLQSELAVKRLYENAVDFRAAISIYEECGFDVSAFVPNNSGHFPYMVESDCIMVRAGLK